jgi:hypothetical protein
MERPHHHHLTHVADSVVAIVSIRNRALGAPRLQGDDGVIGESLGLRERVVRGAGSCRAARRARAMEVKPTGKARASLVFSPLAHLA